MTRCRNLIWMNYKKEALVNKKVDIFLWARQWSYYKASLRRTLVLEIIIEQ